MDKHTEKVKKFIEQKQLIRTGEHILVGISGGADSVCLLLMMNELKKSYDLTIHALHLEHGIRGEDSKKDAVFSSNLCDRLGIDFKMVCVDVPAMAKERKLSLEEAGRLARYEAFAQRCRDIEKEGECRIKLAVAHHGNDNAETLLFNLVRGSGINGACGINPMGTIAEGICVIRPLLCLRRVEIEEYLKAKKQEYCTDVTNLSTDYTRNKIRHNIVPELEEINEGAVEHLKIFADEMREIRDFIDAETAKAFEEAVRIENGRTIVSIPVLLDKHPVIIDRVLKQALILVSEHEKDLTRVHISQLKGLMTLQSGRHIDLPYDVTAGREYDSIVLSRKDDEQSCGKKENRLPDVEELFKIRHFEVSVSGLSDGEIPKKTYTKWFDCDKIKGGLFVRHLQKTDKIIIDGDGHTKSVFDYLKNEKVAAGDRKNVFALCDEENVIWIIGYRINEYYKVTGSTKKVIELDYKIQKG